MKWHASSLIYFLIPIMSAGTTGHREHGAIKNTEYNVARAISDFGYRLSLNLMEKYPHKNILISPTAVAGLLAMTLLGSVGDTYEELADALGFSRDILTNRQNHERLGRLLQVLSANDGMNQSVTSQASAIFVDEHMQLRQAYQQYLERVYNGEAIAADFVDDVKMKNIINEWVKSKTKGKITEFLEKPLPKDTKVALLTALYFLGQWQMPFDQSLTHKDQFKTPTGIINVTSMVNYGNFRYVYSREHALHMVALPYNDTKSTMYVLKPFIPRRLQLETLLNRLTYDEIDTIIDRCVNTTVTIKFPKMEVSNTINLVKPLIELGVKTMFTNGANFALMLDSNKVQNSNDDEIVTRINAGQVEPRGIKEIVNSLPNPGVYIDTVLHQVKININEHGTEAVAVAIGWMARSTERFNADTPFYMFIRNEETKLVTFSAIINDPNSN